MSVNHLGHSGISETYASNGNGFTRYSIPYLLLLYLFILWNLIASGISKLFHDLSTQYL
jgi:hypothetical protein